MSHSAKHSASDDLRGNLHAQFPLLNSGDIASAVEAAHGSKEEALSSLRRINSREVQRLSGKAHAIDDATATTSEGKRPQSVSVGASLAVIRVVSRLQAMARTRRAQREYAEIWRAAMIAQDEDMVAQEQADMMALLGMMDDRHAESHAADAEMVVEARAEQRLAVDTAVSSADHASLYVPTPNAREAHELKMEEMVAHSEEHAELMALVGHMDARHAESHAADAGLATEARAERRLAVDTKVEDHVSLYVPTPHTREAEELAALQQRQTTAWTETVEPAASAFFEMLCRASGSADRVPVDAAIASCAAMTSPLRRLAQRSIAEVLHAADANGDGFLTKEEWRAFARRIALELPVEAMVSFSEEMTSVVVLSSVSGLMT